MFARVGLKTLDLDRVLEIDWTGNLPKLSRRLVEGFLELGRSPNLSNKHGRGAEGPRAHTPISSLAAWRRSRGIGLGIKKKIDAECEFSLGWSLVWALGDPMY